MDEKKLDEMLIDDAIHYLGSFTLPLNDDTLTLVVDEEGNKKAKLDPEFAVRFKALLKRRDQMDEEVNNFKEYAYKFLTENDITDIVSEEGVNLLLTKPYVRNNIDSAKLKEMLPKISSFFTKSVNIKGSVSIKVDKEETYNPWLK